MIAVSERERGPLPSPYVLNKLLFVRLTKRKIYFEYY